MYPRFWTVDSNGKIIPFGHNEPKPRAGDFVQDRERGMVYQYFESRHGLRWWPVAQVPKPV